ncbi:type III-A CRISPR-associated protein Csm2 [uncultured Mitsuokella sp.]|uniref:type III-A CRISPR-associated protein Csm2 n=1 Tax=uncultured Mitsuokella sp. TaxID=453120 RepID=UPI002595F8D9|nr:type III-A CRISPR-associated protein Csm2 [uncultured Mitsuokella sp.]
MNEAGKRKIPDVAAEAESVIQSLIHEDKHGRLDLKTNQIRKFLAAVTSVTNQIEVWHMQHIDTDVLPDNLAAEVKYLKVKLAYQAGREKSVKEFAEKAEIARRIDAIGRDRRKYQEFAHFVEALVAYHRFYGGRES